MFALCSIVVLVTAIAALSSADDGRLVYHEIHELSNKEAPATKAEKPAEPLGGSGAEVVKKTTRLTSTINGMFQSYWSGKNSSFSPAEIVYKDELARNVRCPYCKQNPCVRFAGQYLDVPEPEMAVVQTIDLLLRRGSPVRDFLDKILESSESLVLGCSMRNIVGNWGKVSCIYTSHCFLSGEKENKGGKIAIPKNCDKFCGQPR